jgi:hypothetical protein
VIILEDLVPSDARLGVQAVKYSAVISDDGTITLTPQETRQYANTLGTFDNMMQSIGYDWSNPDAWLPLDKGE